MTRPDRSPRCFDPTSHTTETLCAWCGMTLSGALPPLPDGRENYGMCRRCLSHRLWRLDHPGEAAGPPRHAREPSAAANALASGAPPRRHAHAT